MRRKAGFTLIEVLLALSVLSLLLLPVFQLSTQNVEEVRFDSVELVCATLGRTILERFGREELEALHLLDATSDPEVKRAVDVWRRNPELSELLGQHQIKKVMETYEVKTILTVRKSIQPGLHQITSEVQWRNRKGAAGQSFRNIRYSRLYSDAPALAP